MERIIHPHELQLAWFAGFMDGEGSFGISFQSLPKRKRQSFYVRASVQFSTTDFCAIEEVRCICAQLGVSFLGYSYQERIPEKHLDAHYFRVNRQNDIRIICSAILPYLVIKREACSLLLEFVNRRLENIELDDQGRMCRGGTTSNPYTDADIEIIQALCDINGKRGRDPKKEERQEKFTRFKKAIQEY